jgi:uncharacterized membrane protein
MAKPQENNPTKYAWLYWLAALLALAGLCDAVYLTYQHLMGAHLQCTFVQGCSEVLGSKYAKIGKIPLAGFGAFGYFSAFSLAVLAASAYRWAGKLLALQVVFMVAVTLYLLYLQAYVIEHYCQYCLLSAAVTFSLAIVMLIIRPWRSAADN